MLSIITVVNKREIYNDFLKDSINMQNFKDLEIIEIDNINNEFTNLRDAYNYGLSICKGDIIMFAHPDIRFLKNDELSRIYHKSLYYFNMDSSIKIIGVAGVDFGKNAQIYSSIVHGNSKKEFKNNKELIKLKYKEVQTVDACCFLVKKEYFKNNPFENVLTGYHLLVEELCLRNNKLGYKNIVIPCNIWHNSAGASLDSTYFREALKLLNIYSDLDFFNTSCFRWKCNILLKVKLKFYMVRNYFHHMIIR